MTTQTATQVVTQTVVAAQNTQMQVWLNPTNSDIPAHMQGPWRELCQEMATQVQQALNEEFMKRLCDALASKGLDEETLKDTVLLIVLKKIRNLLDKVLSQFPADVTDKANRVMDEIDAELHNEGGDGEGSGKGDGSGEGAAHGAPFNAGRLGGPGSAGTPHGAAGYAGGNPGAGAGGNPGAGNANSNAADPLGAPKPAGFPSGAQGTPGASLPVSSWDVEAVCSFLGSLELGGLAANVRENGVDGQMLQSLSEEDLVAELGFKKLQARKVFERLPREQGQQGASLPYPENLKYVQRPLRNDEQ